MTGGKLGDKPVRNNDLQILQASFFRVCKMMYIVCALYIFH